MDNERSVYPRGYQPGFYRDNVYYYEHRVGKESSSPMNPTKRVPPTAPGAQLSLPYYSWSKP